MKRVATGTPGLDKALGGGFPEGDVVLLTGGPGSGKTTLCSQFTEEGLDSGRDCLYVTTGQTPKEVREDAQNFGIDLDLSREGLAMARVSPSEDVAEDIREKVSNRSFDRIVLDSISVFQMNWGEGDHLRKYINKLIQHFKELEATVLLTSERPEATEKLTRFGVAEFLVDGVIVLEGIALGKTSYRTARVVKMRRTPVDGSPKTVEFTSSGVKLKPSKDI